MGKIKKYIFAFDPKIKKRVVHIIEKGYAISLVTKNKFKYRPRAKRKKRR